jgi:ribosome-binding protein aMBF1 (putative translation factor)
MKKRTSSNAVEILDRRYPPSAGDLKQRKTFREQIEIAEMIHQAREEAGLSQRQLAHRVGTTASVICRLEDGEYEGHSMAMLRRVAYALDKRVQVRFIPASQCQVHR